MNEQNKCTILCLKKYELVGKIGHGTFGNVFKVRDKETNSIFSAKIFSKFFEQNYKERIRDLVREVNIMAKITHPSILEFIGFSFKDFDDQHRPVIITKYMQNNSLEDIIELEKKSIPPENWDDTQKLINIYGIASAMSYLHSHKIIHRDLKPLNILMDDSLYPIIADFGLAKIVHSNADSLTIGSSSNTKGTAIYIAPETWDNCEYSSAVDVYAFVFIVYEIMTNQKPFSKFTDIKIGLKVVSGERPKFDVPVNESYKNLIERCWSQDPKKRPSFDQVVKELKENRDFITELVNEEKYLNYIEYLNECKQFFDSKKQVIAIDDFLTNESDSFSKIKTNTSNESSNNNEEDLVEQKKFKSKLSNKKYSDEDEEYDYNNESSNNNEEDFEEHIKLKPYKS